jgi:3'(2'), 5'-bisphosphate nucleotidase
MPKSDTEKVITIAKGAGKILMKYYTKEYETKTKNNDANDLVTTADFESNEYIRRELQKAFPTDKILAEEDTVKETDFNGRAWMVDPLDGTKDFVNKGKGFAVMIGLCENGVPKLGVVYGPAQELLYYAEEGKGAYLVSKKGTEKLKVNKCGKIKDSRMVVRFASGEKRAYDKIVDKFEVKEQIMESSIGLKLGIIARKNAEFHINTNLRASKWDTCAPQIILEEAGGKVTDPNGKPLNYLQKEQTWNEPFVASNKIIHSKVIEKFRELREMP